MQLLERLRAETAEAHDELDSAHDGGAFAGLAAYGRFLEAQARIFPVAEAALAASGEYRTLPDWDRRFRADALIADLATLGIAPPQSMPFELQDRPGAATGLAYVLEGSRLGGKLIARKLAQAGLHDAPTSFIAHGADQRFWQSFTAWLANRHPDEAFGDAAVASARTAFALFLEATRREPECH
ncbi:biliverdin-producing heme oxygenase [Pseudohoeflea suaedae]|uniref:biliverdin-producing heme oxygenase n=1 Tax=Pseudohoeflea suaedae TaxID=877384 RepID=UPI0013048366|nr:biliverdin-producing heme oxygenase [Pseudohoeflea suaedae]